jgi:ubiquinone/menaquinone biosynthesis C-methylase UbiE
VPLEYEDKMFDVLLNIDVIEHMEHPNRLINEMHRVLKDGGTLILSTPNVLTLMSRLIFLFEGNLFQFRDGDIPFNGWPGHIAPFFPKLFQEVYKEKFEIESISYSDWIVPFFGWKVPLRSKFF